MRNGESSTRECESALKVIFIGALGIAYIFIRPERGLGRSKTDELDISFDTHGLALCPVKWQMTTKIRRRNRAKTTMGRQKHCTRPANAPEQELPRSPMSREIPTHWRAKQYLHGDHLVVDGDLLGQKIGADRGLVLVAELLQHVLVHQRCLADTEREQKRAGWEMGGAG